MGGEGRGREGRGGRGGEGRGGEGRGGRKGEQWQGKVTVGDEYKEGRSSHTVFVVCR